MFNVRSMFIKAIPISYRQGLACIPLMLVFAAVSVRGEEVKDLLLIPAEMSAKSRESLLTDVININGRLVTVGERGHILYSDDAARSWSQAEVPVSVTLTSVAFVTSLKGWAVGHDGVVLHTGDGGRTWQKQLDGRKINQLMLTQLQRIIEDKTRALTTARQQRNTVRQESLSFELEELDFFLSDVEMAVQEGPTRPLMDLWFKNEYEGIVIGTFGMILHTSDGGTTWVPLLDRIDNPQGLHYYGITRCGDSLLIAGESGILFRSDDLGKNWRSLSSPYEGSFFGITGSPDSRFVIAFGLRGSTYYSHDMGESWSVSDYKNRTSVSGGTLLSDGSIFLASTDGTLMRSTDYGRTFSRLPARVPGTIALTGAGEDKLVVVGIQGISVVKME